MRLADLQAIYGDRIEVSWKSFLLQPEPRDKPLDKFREYTRRWSHESGAAAHESRTVFNIWGDETPPSHSVPSQIAGKVAATFGPEAFDRFHMALMRAYFTDGRTISEKSVIFEIAERCDIDVREFEQRARDQGAGLHKAVFDDMAEGIDLGVHAAPTVVFNGVLPIPGAQDLATYQAMIDRALARQ